MSPSVTVLLGVCCGVLGVGLASFPGVFRDWQVRTGEGGDPVAPTRARVVATRLVGMLLVAAAAWALAG